MAITDELKKKDGSTVQPGAARPTKGLFPYNQPEADIYGGLGKPSSAPENQPGPRGMLGNLPVPPAPVGNPNQIPTSGYSAAPSVPSAAPPVQQESAVRDVARAAFDQVSESAKLGETAQAFGQGARGVLAMAPAVAVDAYRVMGQPIANGLSSAGQTMANFGRGLLGMEDSAKPATPAQPSPQAAMAAGASANPAAPVQANPAVAPSVAPGAPTQPKALETLMGVTGSDVGGGIKRYDVPGKSPLFTNLSGAEGMADNASLLSRTPMTAQNQGAMDGIQARQDARDQQLATQSQYDKEVAAATATNNWQARQSLERAALGTPSFRGSKAIAPSRGAQRVLAGQIQQESDKRGQDITSANQKAVQGLAEKRLGLDTNKQTAEQKLATAKAGREDASAGIENEAKSLTLNAQKAFMNAKTPEERQSAQAMLAGLSGKESAQKAQYAYAPGGQMVDPVTGQTVTQPGVIFNQYTGETAQPGKKQALPDAATAKTQALAALKANPANKEEINKRLVAAGYPTI